MFCDPLPAPLFNPFRLSRSTLCSAKTGFNVEPAFLEPATHIMRQLTEGGITLEGSFDRRASGITVEQADGSLDAARTKQSCC